MSLCKCLKRTAAQDLPSGYVFDEDGQAVPVYTPYKSGRYRGIATSRSILSMPTDAHNPT